MMMVGMLKNLCALVLLALAVSPLTAPFQTYTETKATVVALLTSEDDPGSFVAPLVTNTGRLTVATPAGLGISYCIPVVFLAPFIPPASHIRRDSLRPTVLRV